MKLILLLKAYAACLVAIYFDSKMVEMCYYVEEHVETNRAIPCVSMTSAKLKNETLLWDNMYHLFRQLVTKEDENCDRWTRRAII